MSNKYWQSFGELNDPENIRKKSEDEFREELPFGDVDGKLFFKKKTGYDFFKCVWF